MLLFSFCSCATILLLTLVILRNISKLTQKKNLTSAIFVVIALLGSLHWTTIVIFILERDHINVILRYVWPLIGKILCFFGGKSGFFPAQNRSKIYNCLKRWNGWGHSVLQTSVLV